MLYSPIQPEEKDKWIKWLESQVQVLSGKPEDKSQDDIFKTGEGDVATAKDLVGNLLATLTNKQIEIK